MFICDYEKLRFSIALLLCVPDTAGRKGHSGGVMFSMCLSDSSPLHAFWKCGREQEGDIRAVSRGALIHPRDLTLLSSLRIKEVQNHFYVIQT